MFVDDRLIARAIGTDGQDLYHDDDAEEFFSSPILYIVFCSTSLWNVSIIDIQSDMYTQSKL